MTRNRNFANLGLALASTAIGIGGQYAITKAHLPLSAIVGGVAAGSAAIMAAEGFVNQSADRKIRDLRACYGHSRK